MFVILFVLKNKSTVLQRVRQLKLTHETQPSTNRHFLSGTNKHRYVSPNRFMDILGKQLWQTDKLANREHKAEIGAETAATEVRFGRERVPEIENRPPYSPKNRQLARINIDTTISHRVCLLVFIVHFAKTIELFASYKLYSCYTYIQTRYTCLKSHLVNFNIMNHISYVKYYRAVPPLFNDFRGCIFDQQAGQSVIDFP